MIRNSKTPTLVILFLLGVIGVITYNYWSATQRHMRMREALFLSEEKISELLEKKAYADKQVGMGADRVSRLEKDIDALHKAAEQKDREVEDMNARMKKNQQDRDKFAIENTELKDNLLKAQTESILAQQDLAAKTIEFTNKIEQYKQELEIAKKDTSNCGTLVDSKVQEFRNVVAYMARSQFGKYEAEKLQDILSNAAKNAGLNNNKVDLQSGTLNNNSPLSNTNLNSNINNNNLALSNNINSINEPQVKQIIAQPNNNNNAQSQTLQQQQQQSLQQQSQTNKQISEIRGKREASETESTTSEPETNKLDKEICLLPKSLGTCEKSIERYYFDPTSQRCLLFVYSGCGGNENNFESVEACRNRCESSERVAGEQEDEDRRGGDETVDRNNNAA